MGQINVMRNTLYLCILCFMCILCVMHYVYIILSSRSLNINGAHVSLKDYMRVNNFQLESMEDHFLQPPPSGGLVPFLFNVSTACGFKADNSECNKTCEGSLRCENADATSLCVTRAPCEVPATGTNLQKTLSHYNLPQPHPK